MCRHTKPVVAALLCAAAVPVHAQLPVAVPGLLGVRIEAGQWREYRNVGGGHLYDGGRTRIAYLETERFDGRDYQWVEYSDLGTPARHVTRSLVSMSDPSQAPLRSVESLDAPVPEREPTCDASAGANVRYEIAGERTVHVPAGTFPATAIEYTSFGVKHTAYVSTADPKGIVLIETPNLRTELVASGSGAKSGLGGGQVRQLPAQCPPSQTEGKRESLFDCVQQHVIAAAALGGEQDYDAAWQRATRLCNVNASARMLTTWKGALERVFDASR